MKATSYTVNNNKEVHTKAAVIPRMRITCSAWLPEAIIVNSGCTAPQLLNGSNRVLYSAHNI